MAKRKTKKQKVRAAQRKEQEPTSTTYTLTPEVIGKPVKEKRASKKKVSSPRVVSARYVSAMASTKKSLYVSGVIFAVFALLYIIF